MKYQVTASRKRPKSFQAMVGQEFVTAAIGHSLAHQALANAYLFTGPRGVGKTSSARILATCLNCLNHDNPTITPCGSCTNCLEIASGSNVDVIEIDGASNTSVNDVRDIKDEILFPPSHSRFKIYIIDEVHMLSSGAFNALLKTIEEPPVYVKFIFATTESHKIPATIKSRCQQFNFKLISIDLIKAQLEAALNELNIDYEEEALFWLAKAGKGSMRDAYTLLDQAIAISRGKVTLAELKDKMGFTGIDDLNQLVELALNQQVETALELLHDFFAKGISPEQLIQDLSNYFHCLLIIKHNIQKETLIGAPLSSFSVQVINQLSLDHIKTLLSDLFQLYKSAKLSLNLQFEVELFITNLSQIHLKIDPQQLIQTIQTLQAALLTQFTNNPELLTQSIPNITPLPSIPKTATITSSPSTNEATQTPLTPSVKEVTQTTEHTPESALIHFIFEQYAITLHPEDLLIQHSQCTITLHSAQHYQQLITNKEHIHHFLQSQFINQLWQLKLVYDKIEIINTIFNGE